MLGSVSFVVTILYFTSLSYFDGWRSSCSVGWREFTERHEEIRDWRLFASVKKRETSEEVRGGWRTLYDDDGLPAPAVDPTPLKLPSLSDVLGMKLTGLKSVASRLSLPVSGTRAALQARIIPRLNVGLQSPP